MYCNNFITCKYICLCIKWRLFTRIIPLWNYYYLNLTTLRIHTWHSQMSAFKFLDYLSIKTVGHYIKLNLFLCIISFIFNMYLFYLRYFEYYILTYKNDALIVHTTFHKGGQHSKIRYIINRHPIYPYSTELHYSISNWI